MPNYSIVDTEESLLALTRTLAPAERLFLDTEFESTRQGTRLCLLQMTAGTEVFLVDAISLEDLRPLGGVFRDEQKEWVLHASQQDIPLLQEIFRISAHHRIFDTQIGWALIGPEHSVSLSYLIYRVLGIRTGKSHQADDWIRRPLPASQLAYAAADVEFLPALHRHIAERLSALGRLHVLQDVIAEQLRPSEERTELLDLGSFRNAWQLDATQQASLEYLIQWHNGLTERERRHAPEPKTLLAIAMRAPTSPRDLARIKGVPQRWCAEHGAELVAGICDAAHTAQVGDFTPITPPPYATFEGIRTEAWLQTLRAELSAELQIAPELAFPARILRRLQHTLARGGSIPNPEAVLGGWRSSLIGPTLAAYLTRCPPPSP